MAMYGLALVLFSPLLIDNLDAHYVNISISETKIVTVIDDHFIGVAIDSSLVPVSANWDGLDFSSPKVQLLAKALSPCYLRVGGTMGDEIVFNATGYEDLGVNYTFTGKIWDDLNQFARSVGWDLIFGLNALLRKGLEWDPTNAKELLSYTRAKNYTIAGFELGNEPQFFHNAKRPGPFYGNISGAQLGRDFISLKNLLRSTPGFENTLVIGADNQGLTGALFKEFYAGIGTLAIERITIHQYYASRMVATVAKCLKASVMDSLIDRINFVYSVVKPSNPDTPVWWGETSTFWGSGAPGISNRYVAGFLWLDKLGLSAKLGIKGVIRQTFYGGNYSLIEQNTFDPLPDYWLTLLYKRLVGNKVLKVTLSGEKDIRVYAHCTKEKSTYGYPPGSVILYYLNINHNSTTTLLNLTQFQNKDVMLFSLTPHTPGNLTDRYVDLNGKKLELIDGALPVMEPLKIHGGSVTTWSNTFGFIVVPDANLDICKT